MLVLYHSLSASFNRVFTNFLLVVLRLAVELGANTYAHGDMASWPGALRFTGASRPIHLQRVGITQMGFKSSAMPYAASIGSQEWSKGLSISFQLPYKLSRRLASCTDIR